MRTAQGYEGLAVYHQNKRWCYCWWCRNPARKPVGSWNPIFVFLHPRSLAPAPHLLHNTPGAFWKKSQAHNSKDQLEPGFFFKLLLTSGPQFVYLYKWKLKREIIPKMTQNDSKLLDVWWASSKKFLIQLFVWFNWLEKIFLSYTCKHLVHLFCEWHSMQDYKWKTIIANKHRKDHFSNHWRNNIPLRCWMICF